MNARIGNKGNKGTSTRGREASSPGLPPNVPHSSAYISWGIPRKATVGGQCTHCDQLLSLLLVISPQGFNCPRTGVTRARTVEWNVTAHVPFVLHQHERSAGRKQVLKRRRRTIVKPRENKVASEKGKQRALAAGDCRSHSALKNTTGISNSLYDTSCERVGACIVGDEILRRYPNGYSKEKNDLDNNWNNTETLQVM